MLFLKKGLGQLGLSLTIAGLACLLVSGPSFCIKVVRYWTTETDPISVEIDRSIIQDFMEKHPDVMIQVEFISPGERWPKLMAAMQAGTEPELQYAYTPNVQSWAVKGWLLPLNDVADRLGGGEGKITPSILKSLTLKGDIFGIPTQASVWQLFYRKDIFAEKGFTPPKYRREMLALAEKLTEDVDGDGKVDKWGYTQIGSGSESQQYFVTELWRSGGYLFDKDNEVAFDTTYVQESIDAVTFLKKLGQFCPPGWLSYEYFDAGMAYVGDKAAMCRYAGRLTSHLERYNPVIGGKTASVKFPIDEEKRIIKFWGAADNWCMFKGCKYPELGKEFIYHYMTGKQYIQFLSAVPVHMVPTVDTEKYAKILEELPSWKKYADVWKTTTELMTIPGAYGTLAAEHLDIVNPYMADPFYSLELADNLSAFYGDKISAEEMIKNTGAAWRKTVEEMKAKER